MINRGTSDRIEDAIDRFEEAWTPESLSHIETLLDEFGLTDDDEAIVELIRIDIEFRYERGLSIELPEYLGRFGVLKDRPDRVAQIAFEDYRSRAANGVPVSANRWSGLPGINRELWFQELSGSLSKIRNGDSNGDHGVASLANAALESALEETGFHLVHKIGEGAFSQVFLANQSDLADRFVVLKIVRESLTEPEYMAQLQHTNIVPIYSFHRLLSRSVICMPYSGCVTLDDFLKQQNETSSRSGQSLLETVRDRIDDTTITPDDRPIGNSEDGKKSASPSAEALSVTQPMERFRELDCDALAIWIFQRLAAALAHAHARGVLHNDLKPSNVLIRNDGEPALLDFNLSESLDEKALRRVGGTLPYMSPETFRAMMGQKIRPDAASDIYGLGVMLFQFVTGRLPFPVPVSIAAVDLAAAVDARRSAPDWRLSDQVDPGLRSIIDRCLQFDAADRYGSAEELQVDLQREQQDLNLVHTAEPVSWRYRKWTRRHPRAVAYGIATLVLIALLTPLLSFAMSAAKVNRELIVDADFKNFAEESSEYLSRLMVDPNREREENITEGLAILKEYELLEQDGVEQFLTNPKADPDVPAREMMLRHLVHLAILETENLSQKRLSDPEAAKDFGRLDSLIEATKWVEGSAPSRSRLFLEAERARLAGNTERFETLQGHAESITPETDSELYLEAARLLAHDKHVAARELLSSLADRESIPSAVRWTMLGRAQYGDRRIEDAKLSFTQSIARAPDSVKLRILKGRCHYELFQYNFAEQDYLKAIEMDPEAIGAWSQLGMVHQARREYSEALRCYDKAMELSPGRIWTLLKRSNVYTELGKIELANADYRAAMEAECDNANELLYRAKARRDKEPNAALKDLEEAHRLDPDRAYILHETGHVLARELGRHEEAIKYFDQVVEAQPHNDYALVDRALSLVRLGRTRDALADTQRAMREPNTGKTVYQAACVHALIDRPVNRRRAITLLASAIHKGYAPRDLDGDTDLDSIRDEEEFRVIRQFYLTSQRGKAKREASSSVDDSTITSPF